MMARRSGSGTCRAGRAAIGWQGPLRAGFAHPAPAAGHGEHVHAHHYHPSRTPVHLILILSAVGIAAIVLLIGILSSGGGAPTLAELRAKLGIAPGAPAAGTKLSQVDFMNRLGTPDHREQDPTYIYLYYKIEGGMAVIVVDRGGWEVGEARIRQISTR